MPVVIKYLFDHKYYYREHVVGHEYILVPQRREGVPNLSPELIDEFLATYPLPHWRKEEPTVGPHPEGHANLIGPSSEEAYMHAFLLEFVAIKAVSREGNPIDRSSNFAPQPPILTTTTL